MGRSFFQLRKTSSDVSLRHRTSEVMPTRKGHLVYSTKNLWTTYRQPTACFNELSLSSFCGEFSCRRCFCLCLCRYLELAQMWRLCRVPLHGVRRVQVLPRHAQEWRSRKIPTGECARVFCRNFVVICVRVVLFFAFF